MRYTDTRLPILAVIILALGSGVGCSEEADPAPADQSAQETVAVPVLKVVDYTLTTHCGVRKTDFEGKQWVTHSLGDRGVNNAPAGFDPIQQDGKWQLIADDVAVFTSDGNPPLIYRATGNDALNASCA